MDHGALNVWEHGGTGTMTPVERGATQNGKIWTRDNTMVSIYGLGVSTMTIGGGGDLV